MWERINKYVYFFGFIVSEVQLCHEFFKFLHGLSSAENLLNDILEPLPAFVGSLGLLIYEEIKDLRKSEESDITLLKKFLEILPYEGSISFIDGTDMSATCFDPEKHNDLRNFYYHWDDASHEFIDNNIERRKKILWDLIEEYITALGTNTVSTDDGLQTVPHEWKTEQSKHYKEVVDNFHILAGQIVVAHQEMIRYAKKKLKI